MNRSIRKAYVLFAALLVLWWGPASGEFGLGFNPTASFVSQNGTFTADIVITGLAAEQLIVSTYDFTITFDPAILQFVSASPTGALGADSVFLTSGSPGEVELFEVSLLADAELALTQNVNFLALATLTFTAGDLGTSPLAFGSLLALGGAQFLDPPNGFVTTDLLTLSHTVGSATATVEAARVPEPPTYLLLLLAWPLLARRLKHHPD